MGPSIAVNPSCLTRKRAPCYEIWLSDSNCLFNRRHSLVIECWKRVHVRTDSIARHLTSPRFHKSRTQKIHFFKVVKKHVFFADRRHKKHTICPNWKLFEASKSKIHFKMGHAVVIPVYLWVLNKWTRECWDLESPENQLFQSGQKTRIFIMKSAQKTHNFPKLKKIWNVEIQNAL